MSGLSTCACWRNGTDGRAMSSPASNGSSRTATYTRFAQSTVARHPVTEPSTTDPLCIVAAKATAAARGRWSAGNAGKDENGTPILEASASRQLADAIAVGAMNTKGIWPRSDDIMTPQLARSDVRERGRRTSSRRETRSCRRDRGLALQRNYCSSTWPEVA